MNTRPLDAYLASDLARVEQVLLLRTASSYEFVDLAVQHVISGGGKRLRPALVILAARSLGYDADDMFDLAAAMELIHVGSLVHDDVIDDAGLRRNRETLNAKFGNKVAVLVGDYMHSRVLSILVACRCTDRVLKTVANATQAMCEGEVIGAYKSGDFDLDLDDYYRIIDLKTSGLIAACCDVGSELGSATPAQFEALHRYGSIVGTAFQIVDDVLDVVGQPSKFGKPTRNDIREGKITLPIMRVRDRCEPSERERLKRLYMQETRDADEIAWISDLVLRYGGAEDAFSTAREMSSGAHRALDVLPDTPARDALHDLIDFLIERDF